MFHTLDLELGNNIFKQLLGATIFEDIVPGRKGANLLVVDDRIPLVRTTTNYTKPAQKIKPIHKKIMDKIIKKFGKDINFNNIMIELYTSDYRKMGWHTDQAQDLEKDSYICLFSCYEKDTKPEDIRKLKIKNKKDDSCIEIFMHDSSAILFSAETNSNHLHKIVLDSVKPSNNRWIGMTMRLSKTFIKFIDNRPVFINNLKELKKATTEDIKTIRKLKKEENLNIEFNYPELDFSLSDSDFTVPI